MAESDLPKDIAKPEKIDPSKGIMPEGEGAGETPPKPFGPYMKEGPTEASKAEPSPIDLAKTAPLPPGQPTPESVNAQLTTASGTLGDIQGHLQTKGLKLKRSQNYLLRNKLADSNQHLRAAAQKLGASPGALPQIAGRQNPIMRFLGMVTDSQNQIQEAQAKVQEISKNHSSVNPAELLTVQIKISKAQQELEYCSVLLSNAVSSLKMMFNVQI